MKKHAKDVAVHHVSFLETQGKKIKLLGLVYGQSASFPTAIKDMCEKAHELRADGVMGVVLSKEDNLTFLVQGEAYSLT